MIDGIVRNDDMRYLSVERRKLLKIGSRTLRIRDRLGDETKCKVEVPSWHDNVCGGTHRSSSEPIVSVLHWLEVRDKPVVPLSIASTQTREVKARGGPEGQKCKDNRYTVWIRYRLIVESSFVGEQR